MIRNTKNMVQQGEIKTTVVSGSLIPSLINRVVSVVSVDVKRHVYLGSLNGDLVNLR